MVGSAVLAGGAAAALAAAAAPAVAAPSVRMDQACRVAQGRTATFYAIGTGFAPGARVGLVLNGRALRGAWTASATGQFVIPVIVNAPSAGQAERRLTLAATPAGGGAVRARPFGVSRLLARYGALSSAVPSRARGRFVLHGFAGGGPAAYLHYVQPNGNVRRTVRLGRLRGPCGSLTTPRRKIFPFGNITKGRWTFVYDTQARYRPQSVPYVATPIPIYDTDDLKRCRRQREVGQQLTALCKDLLRTTGAAAGRT